MKKLVNILSVLAFFLLAACSSQEENAADKEKEPKELVISTWGFAEDFFREEIYKPFEEKHNVKIVLDIGNNADRLNKVRQGTADVDVMFLSDYYAQQGIDEDLFEKIDRSKLTNVDKVYDVAKAPLGEEYGPAYTIAQFGIAYNPDEVKQPINSWKDLWNEDLKDSITIPGITSTSGPMFLNAASKVSGSEEFNEDNAFSQMKKIMPNVVKEYNQTSEFVNMFAQGEIVAGPIMEMYFADIQEAVPNAKFVSPEEGGYAVMNTVNVVKGTDQKEVAEEFINYMLSTEVQEKSAKGKIDSPVNTEVKLTDEEAKGLTYGDVVVKSLIPLDMEFVNKNSKAWIDRWNRELAQ
ncbi:ABC transporter substrate-binding protein [Metabacillus sediminilitoris]|uniref:ABC transporter substrate-binding protein n=1 Tax=Metabacillus sediminilitoris TaxID=2567941 RepID=A0A4S4BS67_9BACI|nr:ABC transporter substrate-binding protein [Metabacillus sediminilitoris]QGQ48477.1 extracellular solute-binding protein [Metabacillus sediminilitoris]THF77866.1 ABC transporter substrate-binding protein [Metabacillus sediminilitoris]